MAVQTESLRSLTLQVIDNYRKTAKFATRTLLATSSRGFGKVDAAISQTESKLTDAVDLTKETILAATGKTDQALGKIGGSVKQTLASTQDTINTVADKADSAVEKLLTGTSKRVAKFPPKSGKLGSLLKNDRVKSVESLGIPGAKFLCYVSGKLADGAEQLSNQVAVEKKVKRVVAKKTAKVAKAVKAVRKPVTKTIKTIKAVAKKPVAKKTVARKAAPVSKAPAAVATA